MNEIGLLIHMARSRLWLASAGINDRGEIVFDVDGLDTYLEANCRSLARGQQPSWVPFGVFGSPEEADQACDALLAAIRKRAAVSGKRPPRTLEEKVGRLMRLNANRQWAQTETEPAVG
jgi:hypothetical protein